MRFLQLVLLTAFVFYGACGAQVPFKKKINLNTASVSILTSLPGIGRKRAEQIVLLRKRGHLRRTSELLRIKGVGRKLYRKLRPLVWVGDPARNKANDFKRVKVQ